MVSDAETALSEKIRLIMTLRRQGIRDDRVLAAIERVPREAFVPEPFRDRAYENVPLPLAQGQTISQPYIVALMTEALELQPGLKVLEVGTGSGYQAAVLAEMQVNLFTIERRRSLLDSARNLLKSLGYDQVTCGLVDGLAGWPQLSPYERIIVTAAPEEIPEKLVEQLSPTGVMVIPVGRKGAQQLLRVRMTEDGPAIETLCDVRFVPMIQGISKPVSGP